MMKFNFSVTLLITILSLCLPGTIRATAIENHYTEALSAFTRTGTDGDSWADITGASIASGNFTAGKKYLLIITVLSVSATADEPSSLRIVHGSTAFDSSVHQHPQGGGNVHNTYFWFTVWTAISAEDIKVQLSRIPGAAASVTARQVVMFAMNLSDDLVENTDWAFQEVIADTSLGTSDSTSNNASITLTPGTASHDWLVMSLSRIAFLINSVDAGTKLVRSGEASTTEPHKENSPNQTGDVTDSIFVMSNMRPYTLGAVSNTFTEKSLSIGGTNHTRKASAVFMLDMNKFKNHGFFWNEAEIDLSATSYATEIANIDLTPDDTGYVYILGSWSADLNGASNVKSRLQVGGTDKPGTADFSREQGFGTTNESMLADSARVAVTASTLADIDFDASISAAAAGRAAEDRALIAFTMELAGAPPVSGRRRLTILGVGP